MAAWNDENQEMTQDEFQKYMEEKIQDGVERMKLVVETMMIQNVSF